MCFDLEYTKLMNDQNFIKMNLAYSPKKQQTMLTPRESSMARNHLGELTKAFAAINTSKIEIKTKPPLKRSYSVTPTGTSQGLAYPNGGRPKLHKSHWHSTNDLSMRRQNDLTPPPRFTSNDYISRRAIQNDLLPSPRLRNEVIAAAKKIQSEVLATTHYIKPDIEQKAAQYTQAELLKQNYAEHVYKKLTASEENMLQKSAYFQNSITTKLNSSSQTMNSMLQKQAYSASQQPVQNSVMQKSYIQQEVKQSVTLKLISVQSAEEVSENNERKQVLSITEDKSKKLLEGKLDKSQNEFVGRAGLTHQPVEAVNTKQQCQWTIYSVEQNARRNFARSYVNEITKEAIFTDRKKNELLKQWPMIFHEMVYSSMSDMSDMQSYMKKCLEELEKS